MSSGTTMAADSTQAEPREQFEMCSRKPGFLEYRKTKASDVLRKCKKDVSSAGRSKVHHGKRSWPDDSCSDHESDLDLNNELLPISGYVSNCESMVEHMFRSISMKKLKAMLPEILKKVEINELKQLCTEQLEGMSKDRICRILDGDDPDEISSSETEEQDCNPSQQKVDLVVKDSVHGNTRPRQVVTAASTESLNLCLNEKERCRNAAVINETEINSYDNAQSDVIASNAVRVLPSKKSCFDGIGECELDYNEDSSSESSLNSIPSLASEPEDTCLPFKRNRGARRDNSVHKELEGGQNVDADYLAHVSSTQTAISLHQRDILSSAENENNINTEVEHGRNTRLGVANVTSQSGNTMGLSHAGSKVKVMSSHVSKLRSGCEEGNDCTSVLSAQQSVINTSSTPFQSTQKTKSIASSSTALKLTSNIEVKTDDVIAEKHSSKLGSNLSSQNVISLKTEKVCSEARNVSTLKGSVSNSSKEKVVPVKEELKCVRSVSKLNIRSDPSTSQSKTSYEFSSKGDAELASPSKKAQLVIKKSTEPVTSLSPEAWSKTQLEILELEMRARAIKAMLRSQEELETSEKPPSRLRLPLRTSGLRRERTIVNLGSQRNVYHPSPMISQHRLVRRNVVAPRNRQFAVTDRLARFAPQQLPTVASQASTNARARLGGRKVIARQTVTPAGCDIRRVFTTTAPRRLIKGTSQTSRRTGDRPTSANYRVVQRVSTK